MAEKLRPCLGGIVKHSWEWVRNVDVTKRHSNGDVSFALKGRYRCRNHCGAHKYGPFNVNALGTQAQPAQTGEA